MKQKKTTHKPGLIMHGLSLILIGAMLLPGSVVWAANQPPLSKIPVPVPRTNAELARFPALAQFIQDVPAAIRLGKALFWDMQAGSDGKTACATCHYRAGADPIDIRSRNQLHPGPGGVFQVLSGPSTTLTPANFPFFRVEPPVARLRIDPLTGQFQDALIITSVTSTLNDVAGSQGVVKKTFVSINTGSAIDNGTLVSDPTFTAEGHNVRQVTGRNSPSVINAVFNHANFWDGRANNIFNGVNPFGPADQSARIWVNNGAPGATPVQPAQPITIPNASLASQAVGPPLNDVEMSFAGRTFPQIGQKMLSLTPLGLQVVHPNDVVLGAIANSQGNPNDPGLNTTYANMITAAFKAEYRNGGNVTLPEGTFSHMAANFSLYWGLSVMLYEATLVSDQTPFDRFVAGNQNALGVSAQSGQALFSSQCAVCHSGAELSNAVVGTVSTLGTTTANCFFRNCNPLSFTTNTNHNLIQIDQTIIAGAISDAGFMNLGVRPLAEDAGRAGTTPAAVTGQAYPLSFTLLAQLDAQSLLPFATPSLATPSLFGLATATTPTALEGSFKTPGLRNVELTAPYFHNGSMMDLQQVVEFYGRGGNFPNAVDPNNAAFNNPTIAAKMDPIGSLRIQGGAAQVDMIAFLRSLTDERVRNEQAPFDHPELRIPGGDPSDTSITLPATGGGPALVTIQTFTLTTALTSTLFTTIAIGGSVRDSTPGNSMVTVEMIVNGLPNWATVNPLPLDTWTFTLTPLEGLKIGANTVVAVASTPSESQTINAAFDLLPTATIIGAPIGGTKLNGATLSVAGNGVTSYRYKVDDGAFSADTPVANQIVLAGLAEGFHTLSVVGTAAVGTASFAQPEASATTASWTVKTIPPVLTLGAVTTPTRSTSQMIGGTVELGLSPRVEAGPGVIVGPVQVIGDVWSCQLSGLRKGANAVMVTATDIALNVTSRAASINIVFPTGSFADAAFPGVADAIKALRFAVGVNSPTADDLARGDVAPLDSNGSPAGDGVIGIDDALLILKKVVGLVNF